MLNRSCNLPGLKADSVALHIMMVANCALPRKQLPVVKKRKEKGKSDGDDDGGAVQRWDEGMKSPSVRTAAKGFILPRGLIKS